MRYLCISFSAAAAARPEPAAGPPAAAGPATAAATDCVGTTLTQALRVRLAALAAHCPFAAGGPAVTADGDAGCRGPGPPLAGTRSSSASDSEIATVTLARPRSSWARARPGPGRALQALQPGTGSPRRRRRPGSRPSGPEARPRRAAAALRLRPSLAGSLSPAAGPRVRLTRSSLSVPLRLAGSESSRRTRILGHCSVTSI